jgi:hypothetical protein
MNDPVQMLIDAGAIPTSPFGPTSRYANVAIGRYTLSGGQAGDEASVAYVLRRFVPQARDIPLATRHLVRARDRADTIAADYLGEAHLNWRIADANLVADLLAVTETPGARIAIPLPPGSAGA